MRKLKKTVLEAKNKQARAYGGCLRHTEQKKDAENGETPRGAVNRQRTAGIRMGEPGREERLCHLWMKKIVKRVKPGELKHLSTRRRRKQSSDSVSSGERKRRSPNRASGVEGPFKKAEGQTNGSGSPAAEGESPVVEIRKPWKGILSTTGHEESCRKQPGPSGKAKYSCMTDSEPVP